MSNDITYPTCKTCIYWSINLKVTNGVSDCDRCDRFWREDISSSFTIEATADDSTGLNTMFLTGENFGCIHHKLKGD